MFQTTNQYNMHYNSANIITLYKYQVAGTPIDEIDPILNQLSTRAYFKVYYNCRLRHRHVDSKHTKEKTATLR